MFTTKRSNLQSGFTLVELIVAIGVFVLLATLGILTLIRSQQKSSLESEKNKIVATINEAQGRGIMGDEAGTNETTNFGIYFQQDRYTLFRGTTFVPDDDYNFLTILGRNIRFSSIDLPSNCVANNDCVIFKKRSGEVKDFDQNHNTLQVQATSSGEEITISINKLGVANVF